MKNYFFKFEMIKSSRTGSTVEFLNVIGDKNETPVHHSGLFPTPNRNIMISDDTRSDHENQGRFQVGHQTMTLPGNSFDEIHITS